MEKAIAFLDILGFSNHVYEDLEETEKILHDINELIDVSVTSKFNARKISDKNLYKELKNYTLDSVDFVLPVSDCIFLGSNELNQMIEQISVFLCRILEKTLHDFNINNQKSFPVIMRGGVSYGKVKKVKSSFHVNKKKGDFFNIIGRPVVEAVRLEEVHGSGPSLFLTHDVISQLSEELKKFISERNINDTAGNISYFLWPRYFFFKNNLKNDFSSQFDFTCEKVLRPIMRLYFKYKNEKYSEYYKNLVCIIIEAFSRICLLTKEKNQRENKRYSQRKLKEIIDVEILKSSSEQDVFYRSIYE
jgi:hypothetical protein